MRQRSPFANDKEANVHRIKQYPIVSWIVEVRMFPISYGEYSNI